MNQAQYDQAAYQLAKVYLVQLNIPGVTAPLTAGYLRVPTTKYRPQSIPEIYLRILQSAQNANMKAGVIGRSIGGVEKLDVVLCNFGPNAVLAKFSAGWAPVLDEIVARLAPRGKIRRTSRSIWPRYCLTILSAAQFMSQFASASDFYGWVDLFDHDDRLRAALPMLLDKEIAGVGFALACDFLKELGYHNFAKPDVQLRDIFVGLGLCPADADDYGLFKTIVRVAKHAGVTPYDAD